MAVSKYEKTNLLMLKQIEEILFDWYPEGELKGHKFWIGDPQNGSGDSCNVDVSGDRVGCWYDFATSEGGGDLISLYARKEGLTMPQAHVKLKEQYGPHDPVIVKPPAGAKRPNGALIPSDSKVWEYKDTDGQSLCYVVRKDMPNGGKKFSQVAYDSTSEGWVAKGYPAPKPLYQLDKLSVDPNKKVLVVEGEKCAEAAQKVLGDRAIVTTWMGGSAAVDKTDWSPLTGRDVTIWPDADESGVGQKAGFKIACILKDTTTELKVIDVSDVKRDKWDVADAIADGWDLRKLQNWVKDHVQSYDSDNHKVVQSGNIQNNILQIAPDNTALVNAGGLVSLWGQLGLQLVGQNAKPAANAYNMHKILESEALPFPAIWFDVFEDDDCIQYEGEEVRRLDDSDVITLLRQIQGFLGISDAKKTQVWEYVEEMRNIRRRNWAKEWVIGRKWDGVTRIERFFTDVAGAEDSEYVRMASKNWWVSIAARIVQPGCQVDTMPILEGTQGKGKSRLLRSIGGRFHSEIAEGKFDEKEIIRGMGGKAIVEFGELHAMRKADVTQLKSFLTRTFDTTRALYARKHRDLRRHCVFVGTTNQDEYLLDETGNRRFWPIKTGEIRDQEAAEFREQYYAEAYNCYVNQWKWWIMPWEETEEQQKTRVKSDSLSDTVADIIPSLGKAFKLSEVLDAMDITAERQDFGLQRRVASCLRILGYVNGAARVGNRTEKYWASKEALGSTTMGSLIAGLEGKGY